MKKAIKTDLKIPIYRITSEFCFYLFPGETIISEVKAAYTKNSKSWTTSTNLLPPTYR